MNIILVEDNPVTSMSLSLFFQDNKFNVVDELSYAEDVLKSVERKEPDVLILDIMLKGEKSGLDIAEDLREEGIDIPILFVSALTDENSLKRMKAISQSSYVTKPYDYEKLIEAIMDLAA